MLAPTEPYPRKDCQNERYYSCVMCEPELTYYELRFDAGTVEATVGETITGVTSGDTGVVVSTTLETGTYGRLGDAAGTLELSGVTGASDSLAFEDNESLTGSSTFRGTANYQAIEKKYGLKYPERDMVEKDGKRYCHFHFMLRFRKKDIDADRLEIDEETEH
ncbi:MAG: hypothetical protein M0R06_02580 [Sphaerochaeta sp.]|nr:hypothetical protein [Sphaerochaeta sp.]